jgi:hypothetical protein
MEIIKIRLGCSIQHGGVTYSEGQICPNLTLTQKLHHAANIEVIEEADLIEVKAEEVEDLESYDVRPEIILVKLKEKK